MGYALEGKVALVIGADRRAGGEIAAAFARHGARMVVTWVDGHVTARETGSRGDSEPVGPPPRDADRLRRLVESAGQPAMAMGLDVRDPVAIERLFAASHRLLGAPDILVYDGIPPAPLSGGNSLRDLRLDEWDRYLRASLYGAFVACQHFARVRRSAGGEGALLMVVPDDHVASGTTVAPAASICERVATAGMMELTQAVAAELGRDRITVNTLMVPADMSPAPAASSDRPATSADATGETAGSRPCGTFLASDRDAIGRVAVQLVTGDDPGDDAGAPVRTYDPVGTGDGRVIGPAPLAPTSADGHDPAGGDAANPGLNPSAGVDDAAMQPEGSR